MGWWLAVLLVVSIVVVAVLGLLEMCEPEDDGSRTPPPSVTAEPTWTVMVEPTWTVTVEPSYTPPPSPSPQGAGVTETVEPTWTPTVEVVTETVEPTWTVMVEVVTETVEPSYTPPPSPSPEGAGVTETVEMVEVLPETGGAGDWVLSVIWMVWGFVVGLVGMRLRAEYRWRL